MPSAAFVVVLVPRCTASAALFYRLYICAVYNRCVRFAPEAYTLRNRSIFLSAVVVLGCSLVAVFGVYAQEKNVNVGMVPDAGATQAMLEEKAPLKAYLATEIGREVNLVIPPNYNATIEGLGNGSLDFAYLGGLSYLKAHKQYDVVPLVQRTDDLNFHTLFICKANSSIHSLKDLVGKKFSYGDVNSTAGHLMPYMEMRQAGLEPDTQLHTQYSGSHAATAKLVESGAVDAGALDETIFNAMIADGKLDAGKVRVFYTSKPFVDYVWVARKGVSADLQEKFIRAFLNLREGRNDDVLRLLRGKAYARARNEEYSILRAIAQELKML
jgi:phosphonate transport system substrate-binding protein